MTVQNWSMTKHFSSSASRLNSRSCLSLLRECLMGGARRCRHTVTRPGPRLRAPVALVAHSTKPDAGGISANSPGSTEFCEGDPGSDPKTYSIPEGCQQFFNFANHAGFHARSWAASLAVLLAVLTVALLQHSARAEISDLEKFQRQQALELSVLGMTLDHYKVEKVSPVEALQTLWKTALGREPKLLKFKIDETTSQQASALPPISLDLKDTPVREIVQYIAELSGARWRFDSSTFAEPQLVFEPILVSVCREPTDVMVLNLPASKAKTLGLRPGQSMAEVMKALGGLGASFGDVHFASYDAKIGVLTMLGARSETGFVAALVRLANAGMKIEKPAKGNE